MWTSVHDNPLPGGAVDPTVYDDVVGGNSPAHKCQWCRLSQGHARPWSHRGRGQEEIHRQTEGGQKQELVHQCQLGPPQHGTLRPETLTKWPTETPVYLQCSTTLLIVSVEI